MDQIQKLLVSFAKSMIPFIDFNYTTLSYSDGLKCPIIHFWKHKPFWERFVDEYGDVCEQWSCGKDFTWSACFSSKDLTIKTLSDLPKDFIYKNYIVSKDEII